MGASCSKTRCATASGARVRQPVHSRDPADVHIGMFALGSNPPPWLQLPIAMQASERGGACWRVCTRVLPSACVFAFLCIGILTLRRHTFVRSTCVLQFVGFACLRPASQAFEPTRFRASDFFARACSERFFQSVSFMYSCSASQGLEQAQ